MGWLAWIVLGALAGWIASIIVGRNRQMGCLANILVGVLGGFLGGALVGFLGGTGVTGLNVRSLIVAVLGAVILLAISGWWKGRRR